MTAIFACIVQPKVIEFNVSDQKLHRAQKDEELRNEFKALQLHPASDAGGPDKEVQGQDAELLSQPGGGCRVLSRSSSVSVAAVGTAVCVFDGSLTNAVTLAEDYAPLPEEEPTPSPAALPVAQLLCHLYAKVGVEMLGLLRGAFTFVLYESKTSRVLAARDGSGRSSPLFQARSNGSGSLVLTNSSELLEASGCTDKLELMPGDYKYGWSAVPRRYQPADHARLSRRSLDLATSAQHHHYNQNHGYFHGGSGHGLGGSQGSSRNGSRRSSMDQNNNLQHKHETSTAASPNGNGAGGRHHHKHGAAAQQQQRPQRNGSSGSSSSSSQSSGSQPYRTYVVSAEEPRILKAAPARHHQQQEQQQVLVMAATTAAAGAPEGDVWTAAARGPAAGSGRSKDNGHGQEGGGNGRGASARAAPSGHHNRRHSMDNHGAWRLGSGQPGTTVSAGQQPESGLGEEQQFQERSAPKDCDQKQQQQPAGGAAGAGKQPPPPPQQQHLGTPNNGKSRGRPSVDGHTPGKQQQQKQQHKEQQHKQQQQTAATGKAAKGGASSVEVAKAKAVKPAVNKVNGNDKRAGGAAGTTLRVEAPEFVVCNQEAVMKAAPGAHSVAAAAIVGAP